MLALFSYIIGKVVHLFVLIAAVATLSFVLVSHSPIDPIDAYVGAAVLKISPEQRQVIAERWGLDQPPVTRFFDWTKHILKGDFGNSTIFNEPVLTVIQKRFFTSLWLMASAWLLSGIIGFFLGLVAGTFEGSRLDRAIRLYAYTMASTPTFWVGIVLLTLVSVHLGLTPVCCAWPIGMDAAQASILQRLHHLVLPALTLSLIGIAQITLHTREKTIEAMQSDYAIFACAQGDSRLGIGLHHCLRNVLLPAITLQFASLGELFGGAVLAEQVFSYPGLGRATVEAGVRGDIPLLLGIVLFSTVFVFAGNTIADLLYRIADPRMRSRTMEVA
ncbi:ABC transporter permease [Desulfovibrio inopinatus]|uniref:ABC transporter permease n=1 Tax=Desulfovibrio inopinatus TaxID=102109 RepID=UPI000414B758|nr:ABC transporter permease [Desulfovibrio inopinatus]